MPGVYFDSRHLPDSTKEYVAWVDVMGIQSAMGRSLDIAANFVFKLHVAILESLRDGVQTYPVMDGAYLAACDKDNLIRTLSGIFCRTAEVFVAEAEPQHRYLIRAAIAYGPVIHGNSIPDQASNVFRDNPQYRGSILLGAPMVQAHVTEPLAPPFGIYIHESARTFAEPPNKPFHHLWWKWLSPDQELWNSTREQLLSHFAWCTKNASTLMYKTDRIKVHESMMKEYFEAQES